MRLGFYLYFITLISLFSQSGVIQGVVKDKSGNPLWGSNVYLLGTTLGSSTDSSGSYRIENIPIDKYTIVCDYIGYRSSKRSIYISGSDLEGIIDSQDALYLEKMGLEAEETDLDADILKGNRLIGVDFTLLEDVFDSEEVVVTGIASERSVEVSEVSVTRLKVRKLNESSSYTDFGSLMMAKVSGLDIRKSSGTVGGGFRFDMRAGGGLNGNEQPVIYIDGMRIMNDEIGGGGSNALTTGGQGISTLLDFSPDDIENIEILKGPAAATSYGTNGSNGIVFIETKKGIASEGGPVFNFKSSTGTNSPRFEMDNGFQNRDIFHSYLSDGAIRDNYFSMSGGDYKFRHFLSFSKRHEEGMIIWKDRNFYDRNTFRGNFDFIPQDNLTISLNSSYSTLDAIMPPSDNHIYGVMYNTLVAFNPWQESDSASISQLGVDFEIKRLIASASIKYYPFNKIYKYGLNTFQLNAKIGIDDAERHQSHLFPAGFNYALFNGGTKAMERSNERNTLVNIGASQNYKTGIMKGTTSLSAQFFDQYWDGMEIARDAFGQNAVTDIGSGSNITLAGEWLGNTRDAGAIITQELSFLNQYYVTLSYRKDYSSALGSSSKSIGYPGFRFSTRLDKFDFIPSQFQMLKFRTAYGESGVLPNYTDGQSILYSGSVGGNGSGALISKVGNPEIEPERIKEREFGIDLTWNDLFYLEVTSYKQWAENSVIYRPLAPSMGYGDIARPENIGSMEMDGFEALLTVSAVRNENLNLDLTANYSWNENKVIEMGDPVFDNYGLVTTREGYPKYSLWGQEVISARIDTFDLSLLGLEGSLPFFDPINGLNLKEQGFIDRLVPQHTFNFSLNADYNIFDFSMILERKTGFSTAVGGMWWATLPNNNGHTGWIKSIQKLGLDSFFAAMNIIPGDMTRSVNPLVTEEEIVGTYNEDIFSASGGTVFLPVPLDGKESEWEQVANDYAHAHPAYSSNYGEDGSFTRLREINFGVNLDKYLPKIGMGNVLSGLRVFASAQNVKLWRPKGTVGVDSELNMSGAVTGAIGTTGTGYRSIEVHTMPYPTVYNFGINIRF